MAENLGGVNVSYIWRDIGRKQSLPAAQALFRQNPDLEVVLSPSFHAPFRTIFYTRRGGVDGAGAVKIKSTAVTIPPYANAFNAAAGLCHHFGWRNVVLMNSDDHFMGLAQVFRQRLGEESVVIRSHTIISSALADEAPTESGNPSSKVQVRSTVKRRWVGRGTSTTCGWKGSYLSTSSPACGRIHSYAVRFRGYPCEWCACHLPHGVMPVIPRDLNGGTPNEYATGLCVDPI